MALKNKEQFDEIAESIEQAVSGIYEERDAMSNLTEARSVTRRQERIDQHITNISTQGQRLRDLIEETNKPVPRKRKATPEELPGQPGNSDTPNEDGSAPPNGNGGETDA